MEEMLDRYAAAVREKDVDALVSLYADDVRTFDLWSVWSYDSKDALRRMVAEWFGSVGDDQIGVDYEEVRTQVGEEVAGLSAFLTYRGISASGEELRSMNNRLTWVLSKDFDGNWKIAHEHTSAPAGEGGKVDLKR